MKKRKALHVIFYPLLGLALSVILFFSGRYFFLVITEPLVHQHETVEIHPQVQLLEKALNDTSFLNLRETIKLNIERWKRVPVIKNQKFIFINIADYSIKLLINDSVLFSAKAIVGRPYRQTPEIFSSVTHVEFNPVWIVPPTILRNDILPILKKDKQYLLKNKIRLFMRDSAGSRVEISTDTINWKRVNPRTFRYEMIQDAGPHNALGVVKFVFPNPHLVYLHDTPSGNLFNEDERAFSSGCIRVEKAIHLAGKILPDDWTLDKINSTVQSLKNTRVTLKKPVPVIIGYFTCWIDENGVLQIRKDIYNRDKVKRVVV